MGSSLRLKFAVLFSISLAGAASFATTTSATSFPFFKPKPKPKATVSDLLSLLGSHQQALSVNSQVARELRSCFKFLVPFSPIQRVSPEFFSARRLLNDRNKRDDDEMIWWPPAPVMELARLAVDSGGDPGAIHIALDPTIIPVPDVEGTKEDRCELTRTPYGRHFINEELNSYLKFLFEIIVQRGPSVGLNVSLNRYDFFHGHLFLAMDSGRLGVLVVLDADPKGIIYQDLIPEYVHVARTLYEDDFGEVAVDVNYLNIGVKEPNFEIFIC